MSATGYRLLAVEGGTVVLMERSKFRNTAAGFVIAASFALAAGPANPQSDSEIAWMATLFGGWDGVVFECQYQGASNDFNHRLCGRITSEFEFIAEFSGVPYSVSRGQDIVADLEAANELGQAVSLSVVIHSTEASYGSLAATVQISAEVFGLWADTFADPGSPQSIHRPGNLVLWKRSVVGSGSVAGEDFVRAMSEGTLGHLRSFLISYNRGQEHWNETQ